MYFYVALLLESEIERENKSRNLHQHFNARLSLSLSHMSPAACGQGSKSQSGGSMAKTAKAACTAGQVRGGAAAEGKSESKLADGISSTR